MTNFAPVFGGLISFILLMLYTVTVGFMMYNVVCFNEPIVSEEVVFVVTTINGLVSALVITSLTITEPGKTPTIGALANKLSGDQQKWVTRFTWLYLSIWLTIGLAALIIGVMIFPEIDPNLKDIGTTWLGLAVAAGYSYFGINPASFNK